MNNDKLIAFVFVGFCLVLLLLGNLFTHFFGLDDGGEAERLECIANTLVEFAHEFDPVQTQGVQESGQTFHHDQNSQSATYWNKINNLVKYSIGIEVAITRHKPPQAAKIM